MPEKLGRYEILDPIGEGGFAIVYRGNDTSLDRQVALKELRPLLLQDKTWVRRFQREAKTIARLDHPHIVPIYDVYHSSDRLFIVMRLVDNASLEDIIQQQGRLGWADTLRVMLPICAGLHYAHSSGILHRDLKPANILIDSERGPMLSDFGLAKLVGEHSMSVSVTETGSIVGTPHYIAPEVWEGKGNTAQADIYALGCILYEAITGEKIFKGDTPPAVMMAHFKPLQFPPQWPDDVPPDISRVLIKALAHDPTERYDSALELAQELADLSPELAEALENTDGLIASPFVATGVIKTPTPNRLRRTGESIAPINAETPATATAEELPPNLHDSAPAAASAREEKLAAPAGAPPAAPRPIAKPRRGGCLLKSIVAVGILVIVLVGLTAFCAAAGIGLGQGIGAPVEAISSYLGQNIDIIEPVTETITALRPADPAPVRLEMEVTTGQLNLQTGATDALAEGTVTYNVNLLKPQVVSNGSSVRIGPEGTSSDLILLLAYDFLRTDIQNTWNMTLADAPMTLVLNTGTADADVSLEAYALNDMVISQGPATTLDLIFAAPNQIEMNTLDFNGGPTLRVSMSRLANSRANSINLVTAAGDYDLDFGGQLQNDIAVKITGELNTLTITAPASAAAQVNINGNINSVNAAGTWQTNGDSVSMPGQGHTITIDLSMNAESLRLRN